MSGIGVRSFDSGYGGIMHHFAVITGLLPGIKVVRVNKVNASYGLPPKFHGVEYYADLVGLPGGHGWLEAEGDPYTVLVWIGSSTTVRDRTVSFGPNAKLKVVY